MPRSQAPAWERRPRSSASPPLRRSDAAQQRSTQSDFSTSAAANDPKACSGFGKRSFQSVRSQAGAWERVQCLVPTASFPSSSLGTPSSKLCFAAAPPLSRGQRRATSALRRLRTIVRHAQGSGSGASRVCVPKLELGNEFYSPATFHRPLFTGHFSPATFHRPLFTGHYSPATFHRPLFTGNYSSVTQPSLALLTFLMYL